ncbi:glycosyltransferase [Altibacter sp.]|uniref:glycosyltransferase n=1 Tax=Altibacter sp. TaxID=2024823 RepID=UPI0025872D7C|nr:glycosyltransferase [Altibacter sp.]MCW9038814.1 glycosyltransferase [Altibacter sp.]
MANTKTILVAPLHWGLGHATRCIPIIRALLEHGYRVMIASDGPALLLLQKEFPQLPSLELPSYDITYPKKGAYFKWSILSKLPHLRKTISEEKKLIATLVAEGRIDGLISDNRLGVRNKNIPSVFITHQLNVLSGDTTYFSSKLHQKTIKKFTACWVPDVAESPNLSGKLGHLNDPKFPVTYIGPLSRMQQRDLPVKYDILALLSGPEPQRSLLEEILVRELQDCGKRVLIVRGKVEAVQKRKTIETLEIVNYMNSSELETAINQSDVVVSRSGYTTLMDLAALQKKAFFIPTPGQYEQEYLAKRLKEQGLVPCCKQERFTAAKLLKIPFYKGLQEFKPSANFKELFRLFEGE